MRINKQLIKRHRHASQLAIPLAVKTRFKRAIQDGEVPSSEQIKLAVSMGLVKKNGSGRIDARSLTNYFKTFIKQRKADDSRN